MKQHIVSFVIFAGCVLAFSASIKAQTPIQLNDHLTAITDSLFIKGERWGAKFDEAFDKKDFSIMKPYSQNLERFIDARIIELKNMKDVKNSKNLRLAMLDFLKYEKIMVTSGFKQIENLPSTATLEEVTAAYEILKKYTDGEEAELNKVGDAQEAYANANGFRIESAKKKD